MARTKKQTPTEETPTEETPTEETPTEETPTEETPTEETTITYLGPATETVAFGLTFPIGVSVAVSDEHAYQKLSNNPCFTAVK